MRTLLLSSLLVSAALAAGCASAPDPAPTAGKADDKRAVGSFTDTTPLTGSRFARSTTDRNVRVIGNDGAREDAADVRSIGNTVGARSN